MTTWLPILRLQLKKGCPSGSVESNRARNQTTVRITWRQMVREMIQKARDLYIHPGSGVPDGEPEVSVLEHFNNRRMK